MKTVHIPNKIPGRHRCECQARIHSLIMNCGGCGRIVCEQEGSGPCVFCGKFVCTREERQTIENDKKNGLTLEKKIMKQAGFGSDMSRLRQEEEAKTYRDTLLKADRESIIRNKVYDLDSDYYSIETANFLTEEEKKAIQRRKDELKRLNQNRARRRMLIEMDFEAGIIKETAKNATYEKFEDAEIQSILRKAEERQEKQKTELYKLRDPNLPNVSKFIPKYDEENSNSIIPSSESFELTDVFLDRDQTYSKVARNSFYLSFPQPLASQIVSGKKCCVPVNEEILVEGPVYIISRQNENDQTGESELPEFSIIGKAILANCITMAEFSESHKVEDHSNETFVLIFEDPTEIETHFPFVTSTLFGQLPKTVQEMLNVI